MTSLSSLSLSDLIVTFSKSPSSYSRLIQISIHYLLIWFNSRHFYCFLPPYSQICCDVPTGKALKIAAASFPVNRIWTIMFCSGGAGISCRFWGQLHLWKFLHLFMQHAVLWLQGKFYGSACFLWKHWLEVILNPLLGFQMQTFSLLWYSWNTSDSIWQALVNLSIACWRNNQEEIRSFCSQKDSFCAVSSLLFVQDLNLVLFNTVRN